jgi:TetR/AcrR family transcriptional regulator
MATERRLGSKGSEMRNRFIDAAEAILSEGGGSTISSRIVAERAGLKMQLLYYYFKTMDDLLLAVVGRVNERRLARFEEALASDNPLRALWEQLIEPTNATLAAEMIAMAKQREAVRAEIVEFGQKYRLLQTSVVEHLLAPPDPDAIQYSAAGVVMIAAAVARMLINEAAVGFTEGHGEALSIVEQLIDRLEPASRAVCLTAPPSNGG